MTDHIISNYIYFFKHQENIKRLNTEYHKIYVYKYDTLQFKKLVPIREDTAYALYAYNWRLKNTRNNYPFIYHIDIKNNICYMTI